MRSLMFWLLAITSTTVHAQAWQLDQPLAPLRITDKGNIALKGDDLHYLPWSTTDFDGKVVYLQYMAARPNVETLNKPLSDAIEARAYPLDRLYAATIVNRDDAIWGTGAFIAGQLKKNKIRYPDAHIILDSNGTGLRSWQLQPNTSAIAIVDPAGIIRFAKQGPLTDAEIAQVIQLLDNWLL